MKLFIVLFALVAAAAADVSHLDTSYLPPVHQAASSPVGSYSYGVAESAPAPSYSAPAPVVHYAAASAPAPSYSASEEHFAATAPVVAYETPAASAPAPAHTFSSDDGYRYKTHRRVVYRHRQRRGVSTEYLPPAASTVSAEYLPPAASAPAPSYSAPVVQQVAASAPAPSYSVPAASFETVAASALAPAHSFSSDDGYRYKTQRRVVYRHRQRRGVSTEYLPPAASTVSAEYLPPAASAPAPSYSAPASVTFATAPVVQQVAASAPAPSYSAPAASFETVAASAPAPAHSFSSDDGYRYKTQRRVVYRHRHRRGVSTEYLPPAASTLSAEYLPPAASAPAPSYSEPAPSYSVSSYSAPAPVVAYDSGAASAPAHSFSEADGYRYKTARRRVIRRRRF